LPSPYEGAIAIWVQVRQGPKLPLVPASGAIAYKENILADHRKKGGSNANETRLELVSHQLSLSNRHCCATTFARGKFNRSGKSGFWHRLSTLVLWVKLHPIAAKYFLEVFVDYQ